MPIRSQELRGMGPSNATPNDVVWTAVIAQDSYTYTDPSRDAYDFPTGTSFQAPIDVQTYTRCQPAAVMLNRTQIPVPTFPPTQLIPSTSPILFTATEGTALVTVCTATTVSFKASLIQTGVSAGEYLCEVNSPYGPPTGVRTRTMLFRSYLETTVRYWDAINASVTTFDPLVDVEDGTLDPAGAPWLTLLRLKTSAVNPDPRAVCRDVFLVYRRALLSGDVDGVFSGLTPNTTTSYTSVATPSTPSASHPFKDAATDPYSAALNNIQTSYPDAASSTTFYNPPWTVPMYNANYNASDSNVVAYPADQSGPVPAYFSGSRDRLTMGAMNTLPITMQSSSRRSALPDDDPLGLLPAANGDTGVVDALLGMRRTGSIPTTILQRLTLGDGSFARTTSFDSTQTPPGVDASRTLLFSWFPLQIMSVAPLGAITAATTPDATSSDVHSKQLSADALGLGTSVLLRNLTLPSTAGLLHRNRGLRDAYYGAEAAAPALPSTPSTTPTGLLPRSTHYTLPLRVSTYRILVSSLGGKMECFTFMDGTSPLPGGQSLGLVTEGDNNNTHTTRRTDQLFVQTAVDAISTMGNAYDGTGLLAAVRKVQAYAGASIANRYDPYTIVDFSPYNDEVSTLPTNMVTSSWCGGAANDICQGWLAGLLSHPTGLPTTAFYKENVTETARCGYYTPDGDSIYSYVWNVTPTSQTPAILRCGFFYKATSEALWGSEVAAGMQVLEEPPLDDGINASYFGAAYTAYNAYTYPSAPHTPNLRDPTSMSRIPGYDKDVYVSDVGSCRVWVMGVRSISALAVPSGFMSGRVLSMMTVSKVVVPNCMDLWVPVSFESTLNVTGGYTLDVSPVVPMNESIVVAPFPRSTNGTILEMKEYYMYQAEYVVAVNDGLGVQTIGLFDAWTPVFRQGVPTVALGCATLFATALSTYKMSEGIVNATSYSQGSTLYSQCELVVNSPPGCVPQVTPIDKNFFLDFHQNIANPLPGVGPLGRSPASVCSVVVVHTYQQALSDSQTQPVVAAYVMESYSGIPMPLYVPATGTFTSEARFTFAPDGGQCTSSTCYTPISTVIANPAHALGYGGVFPQGIGRVLNDNVPIQYSPNSLVVVLRDAITGFAHLALLAVQTPAVSLNFFGQNMFPVSILTDLTTPFRNALCAGIDPNQCSTYIGKVPQMEVNGMRMLLVTIVGRVTIGGVTSSAEMLMSIDVLTYSVIWSKVVNTSPLTEHPYPLPPVWGISSLEATRSTSGTVLIPRHNGLLAMLPHYAGIITPVVGRRLYLAVNGMGDDPMSNTILPNEEYHTFVPDLVADVYQRPLWPQSPSSQWISCPAFQAFSPMRQVPTSMAGVVLPTMKLSTHRYHYPDAFGTPHRPTLHLPRSVLQGGVAAALGSSQLGTHVSDDLRILTSLSVTTQGSTSQSCTSSSTQGLSTSVSCTATTAIQTTHTVFSLSTGAVAMTLRGGTVTVRREQSIGINTPNTVVPSTFPYSLLQALRTNDTSSTGSTTTPTGSSSVVVVARTVAYASEAVVFPTFDSPPSVTVSTTGPLSASYAPIDPFVVIKSASVPVLISSTGQLLIFELSGDEGLWSRLLGSYADSAVSMNASDFATSTPAFEAKGVDYSAAVAASNGWMKLTTSPAGVPTTLTRSVAALTAMTDLYRPAPVDSSVYAISNPDGLLSQLGRQPPYVGPRTAVYYRSFVSRNMRQATAPGPQSTVQFDGGRTAASQVVVQTHCLDIASHPLVVGSSSIRYTDPSFVVARWLHTVPAQLQSSARPYVPIDQWSTDADPKSGLMIVINMTTSGRLQVNISRATGPQYTQTTYDDMSSVPPTQPFTNIPTFVRGASLALSAAPRAYIGASLGGSDTELLQTHTSPIVVMRQLALAGVDLSTMAVSLEGLVYGTGPLEGDSGEGLAVFSLVGSNLQAALDATSSWVSAHHIYRPDAPIFPLSLQVFSLAGNLIGFRPMPPPSSDSPGIFPQPFAVSQTADYLHSNHLFLQCEKLISPFFSSIDQQNGDPVVPSKPTSTSPSLDALRHLTQLRVFDMNFIVMPWTPSFPLRLLDVAGRPHFPLGVLQLNSTSSVTANIISNYYDIQIITVCPQVRLAPQLLFGVVGVSDRYALDGEVSPLETLHLSGMGVAGAMIGVVNMPIPSIQPFDSPVGQRASSVDLSKSSLVDPLAFNEAECDEFLPNLASLALAGTFPSSADSNFSGIHVPTFLSRPEGINTTSDCSLRIFIAGGSGIYGELPSIASFPLNMALVDLSSTGIFGIIDLIGATDDAKSYSLRPPSYESLVGSAPLPNLIALEISDCDRLVAVICDQCPYFFPPLLGSTLNLGCISQNETDFPVINNPLCQIGSDMRTFVAPFWATPNQPLFSAAGEGADPMGIDVTFGVVPDNPANLGTMVYFTPPANPDLSSIYEIHECPLSTSLWRFNTRNGRLFKPGEVVIEMAACLPGGMKVLDITVLIESHSILHNASVLNISFFMEPEDVAMPAEFWQYALPQGANVTQAVFTDGICNRINGSYCYADLQNTQYNFDIDPGDAILTVKDPAVGDQVECLLNQGLLDLSNNGTTNGIQYLLPNGQSTNVYPNLQWLLAATQCLPSSRDGTGTRPEELAIRLYAGGKLTINHDNDPTPFLTSYCNALLPIDDCALLPDFQAPEEAHEEEACMFGYCSPIQTVIWSPCSTTPFSNDGFFKVHSCLSLSRILTGIQVQHGAPVTPNPSCLMPLQDSCQAEAGRYGIPAVDLIMEGRNVQYNPKLLDQYCQPEEGVNTCYDSANRTITPYMSNINATCSLLTQLSQSRLDINVQAFCPHGGASVVVVLCDGKIPLMELPRGACFNGYKLSCSVCLPYIEPRATALPFSYVALSSVKDIIFILLGAILLSKPWFRIPVTRVLTKALMSITPLNPREKRAYGRVLMARLNPIPTSPGELYAIFTALLGDNLVTTNVNSKAPSLSTDKPTGDTVSNHGDSFASDPNLPPTAATPTGLVSTTSRKFTQVKNAILLPEKRSTYETHKTKHWAKDEAGMVGGNNSNEGPFSDTSSSVASTHRYAKFSTDKRSSDEASSPTSDKPKGTSGLWEYLPADIVDDHLNGPLVTAFYAYYLDRVCEEKRRCIANPEDPEVRARFLRVFQVYRVIYERVQEKVVCSPGGYDHVLQDVPTGVVQRVGVFGRMKQWAGSRGSTSRNEPLLSDTSDAGSDIQPHPSMAQGRGFSVREIRGDRTQLYVGKDGAIRDRAPSRRVLDDTEAHPTAGDEGVMRADALQNIEERAERYRRDRVADEAEREEARGGVSPGVSAAVLGDGAFSSGSHFGSRASLHSSHHPTLSRRAFRSASLAAPGTPQSHAMRTLPPSERIYSDSEEEEDANLAAPGASQGVLDNPSLMRLMAGARRQSEGGDSLSNSVNSEFISVFAIKEDKDWLRAANEELHNARDDLLDVCEMCPIILVDTLVDTRFTPQAWMLVLESMYSCIMLFAAVIESASAPGYTRWEVYQSIYFRYMNSCVSVGLIVNTCLRRVYLDAPTFQWDPFVLTACLLCAPALVTHVIPGLAMYAWVHACILALWFPLCWVIRRLESRVFNTMNFFSIAFRVIMRLGMTFVVTLMLQSSYNYAVLFYSRYDELGYMGILQYEWESRRWGCLIEIVYESIANVLQFVSAFA